MTTNRFASPAERVSATASAKRPSLIRARGGTTERGAANTKADFAGDDGVSESGSVEVDSTGAADRIRMNVEKLGRSVG
jgi:hypothetical protein